MISIVTTTSRLKLLDGTLANGVLSVHPSVPFTVTEGGVKSRITQNSVRVAVVDGVLAAPLALEPCRGTSVSPAATVYYVATLRFGAREETQHWAIADTAPAEIEITDVTLA